MKPPKWSDAGDPGDPRLPRRRGGPLEDPARRAGPPRLPPARGLERRGPRGRRSQGGRRERGAPHRRARRPRAAGRSTGDLMQERARTPTCWTRGSRPTGRRSGRCSPGAPATPATRSGRPPGPYRASWEARAAAQLRAAGGVPEVGGPRGRRRGGGRLGARAELDGACDSPTSCYALAVAALARGDDPPPARGGRRHGGGRRRVRARRPRRSPRWPPATRTRYRAAVAAIVADFEGRDAHLTGVAGGRHGDADGGPGRRPRHGRPPATRRSMPDRPGRSAGSTGSPSPRHSVR